MTIHTLTAQSIAIVTIAYKNLIELAIKFHQDGRGAKKNRQKHNAKVGHIFYRVCQGVDHHIQALVGFKRPSSGRASCKAKNDSADTRVAKAQWRIKVFKLVHRHLLDARCLKNFSIKMKRYNTATSKSEHPKIPLVCNLLSHFSTCVPFFNGDCKKIGE